MDDVTQESQCTYRCVVLPDAALIAYTTAAALASQCTYRCVVLPDQRSDEMGVVFIDVSMHLQVRGAP